MSKKIIERMLAIITLAVLTSGCAGLGDREAFYPNGHRSYADIRGYAFNPQTILASAAPSNSDSFRLLPDWGQQPVAFSPGSFPWNQQDYLRIAAALNKVAAQDDLANWSVFSLGGYRQCADNPHGFDLFLVTYFKADGDRYFTRELEIYPLLKEADWDGDASFPRPFFFGWKSVDLPKLKVTMDDALRLAEAAGGRAARQKVNNACAIGVDLIPNLGKESWDVIYTNAHLGYLYHFGVSPYSDGSPGMQP